MCVDSGMTAISGGGGSGGGGGGVGVGAGGGSSGVGATERGNGGALRQLPSGTNPGAGASGGRHRSGGVASQWASQDSWTDFRNPYSDNPKSGHPPNSHPQSSNQQPLSQLLHHHHHHQQQQQQQQQPTGSNLAQRGLKGRSSSYDYDPYRSEEYGRNRSDIVKSSASMSGNGSGKDGHTLAAHHPQHPAGHMHQHRHRHPHHHPHHHHHHHNQQQQSQHQQQQHIHHNHQRQPQSSSEDELRSTSECTSCEDVEVESESVSEKGTALPLTQQTYAHSPSVSPR